MRGCYEYSHVVSFEETNLVGNVYYVNHLKWQGRCREMFLREHAPDVVEMLGRDFVLATVRCSCEYVAELHAFDLVSIEMRLIDLTPTRIAVAFDYLRVDGPDRELAAKGDQLIACMSREGGRLVPAPVPRSLAAALLAYSPSAAIAAAAEW